MFMTLLAVSVVLAFAVSGVTAWAFAKPIDRILARIASEALAPAWARYLRFAIVVTGVSCGVRVHALERYISPTHHDGRERIVLALTTEHRVLELYRTAIEALQGIAWLLLVFFVFALLALVIVRIAEGRRGAGSVEP